MENKTKIVVYTFLCIFLLFNQSCSNTQIKNPALCVKLEDGNWQIKSDKSVLIKEVIVEGKMLLLDEIIDFKTFDYLYKYKEDSAKFKNAFYFHNPPKIYFKDRNFLYFLVNDSLNNFYLNLKCKANGYEIVGGEYIKIYPIVYWRDKKIANADYHTFKTMNVPQNKSEWDITIGLDKKNIFYGDKVMQKNMFDSLFWANKDSLKIYYHY